jgi:hypothetical protein
MVSRMALTELGAVEDRGFDRDPSRPRADASRRFSDEDVRRLRLDNEDLRFECVRLKASIAQAQAEIVSLAHRNGMLQRRLEQIYRLVPHWGVRLFRAAMRRFRPV